MKAKLALFSVGVLGLALVASPTSATLYNFKYTGIAGNPTLPGSGAVAEDAPGTPITSGDGAFTFETFRGITALTGANDDTDGSISDNAFPIDANFEGLSQGTPDAAFRVVFFAPASQDSGVGTHEAWASAMDGSSGYAASSLGLSDACNDCVADASATIASAGGLPDVSTWAMMLLGFAGLGFAGYRKTTRDWAVAA